MFFFQFFVFFFSFYDTKAVFLALGITAVVCITVTVFCFQTKVWVQSVFIFPSAESNID